MAPAIRRQVAIGTEKCRGAAAGRIPPQKDPAAISRHDDLILYHVEPDEPGLVLFLKMTVDGVSHHLT